jgi:fluoroquinolone resistance protein
MEKADIYDQQFDQQDFSKNNLHPGEYEKCSFLNCDFAGSDLSHVFFTDCSFTGCNISNVKLNDTAFRNATFQGCKMLGLHFENCNPFLLEMNFDKCILNHSSFYQLKLEKASLTDCILQEVDFTEAHLRQSDFSGADLSGAIFDQTILEEADFRAALHFTIHPPSNKITKAKFSVDGLAGLLYQYDIKIE